MRYQQLHIMSLQKNRDWGEKMRNFRVVIYFVICQMIFTGCGKQEVVFGNEDGLMVKYCYKSMGEQFFTDVTDYELELYQDYIGVLEIKNPIAEEEESDVFRYEFVFDEDEIDEILNSISSSKLLRKSDISQDGNDGYYSTLTFYTPTEHMVGGYLASNKEYETVVSKVLELIDIKYYLNDAQEEVDRIYAESNSL